MLTVDRIADFLEICRAGHAQQIVIKHLDLKSDANRIGQIVLSPRHARHLASLLILHAEEAEAEAQEKGRG
jgi:hypothetical protein